MSKPKVLLNVITLLAFGSALIISVHAFAVDLGAGVGGAVNHKGAAAGAKVGGVLDRGTGAADVRVHGGNDAGGANAGVAVPPAETHGSINADGSVSVDSDRVKDRAAHLRKKAKETKLPNAQADGELNISK